MRFETSALPARPWPRARGTTHLFTIAAVLALQLARAPDARAQARYPDPNDEPGDPPRPTLPSRVECGGTIGAVLGFGTPSFTGPHAGASLQGPLAPMLDVRIDVQAIFTFARELPTTERVTTALIWHPPARRRASPGGHR